MYIRENFKINFPLHCSISVTLFQIFFQGRKAVLHTTMIYNSESAAEQKANDEKSQNIDFQMSYELNALKFSGSEHTHRYAIRSNQSKIQPSQTFNQVISRS